MNVKLKRGIARIVEVSFVSACNWRASEGCDIREYGSTLTNLQPLLLSTQAGMPYTGTHKHRTSYYKSTLTFIGPAKRWKCLSSARQKREILAILYRVGTCRITH